MVKIKLWQKVYITVLVLSVILINCGIYLTFNLTFKKNISGEQQRSDSEFDILCSNISKDIVSLDQKDRMNNITIYNLINDYQQSYNIQGVHLQLWNDTTCLFPSESTNFSDFSKISEGKIVIRKNQGGVHTVYIKRKLEGQPNLYLYY